MASSKLLEAAVKDKVVVCSYVAPSLVDMKKLIRNITRK